MRNKENKKPLINQLNRTIGNLTSIQKSIHKDDDLRGAYIQLKAVQGGVKKMTDTLPPDFADTEIKAILKSLIASKLYDPTHVACFVYIRRDLKNKSPVKRLKIYDILHKNYPNN